MVGHCSLSAVLKSARSPSSHCPESFVNLASLSCSGFVSKMSSVGISDIQKVTNFRMLIDYECFLYIDKDAEKNGAVIVKPAVIG